jgi:hypothetical protein
MPRKVIDFRLRPPVEAYRTLFTFKLSLLSGLRGAGVSPLNAISASMTHVGEDEGLNLLLQEMDQAGIEIGVMNGRHGLNSDVDDDTLVGLQKKYPGRLYGYACTNLEKPMDETLRGIEAAVRKLKLRGVTIEPGINPSGAMYPDDERLYPIYEKCIALDVPLLFMTGFFCGPDIGYNDPARYDRVAGAFPKLQIVLGHGCFPYVTQAIGLTIKRRNVYLSPDCYIFMPGGELYIRAFDILQERLIFATAFPFADLVHSVQETLKFPIREEVMNKYLYENAAKLLRL